MVINLAKQEIKFLKHPSNQLRCRAYTRSKSNPNDNHRPLASTNNYANVHQSISEVIIKRFDARQRYEKGLKFKAFAVQIPGQAGYDI